MIPNEIVKKLDLVSETDGNAHFETDPDIIVCDCKWEGIVKIKKVRATKTITLYYSENYILKSGNDVREKIIREVNSARNL